MRTWLVVVLLFAVQPVAAQPAQSTGAPTPDRVDRAGKIKQRIRALRAYALTEQLELDEPTAAKLFPALAKYDDELDKLLLSRADVQQRLRQVRAGGDPAQINKLIDEAVSNQRAVWDAEDRRLAQLRKILTPAQTARVLIVLPQMERKIQQQLRRVAQKRVPARPKQTSDPSGELDVNPFESSSDVVVDPFATPARPKRARQPSKRRACDPFSTARGCR